MLKESYPYYLANKAMSPNASLEVTDKFTGKVATRTALADERAIEQAISAASKAEEAMRKFPPYARQEVLEHCVSRFHERAEEFAQALCVEAGKPIRDARGEVTRLIDTFKVAAEESVRISGEVLNLEISKRAQGYRGMTKRVPIGACSLITPFNFPLNLVAHKVAPAIAAGCPFVLKPSERTPVGALMMGEVLAETSLPEGAFSVLPCLVSHVAPFIEDPRFKLLSFTGSKIGWDLRAKAGRKKVILELGGNASCVVDKDPGASLDWVIERVAFGAYYQSGQSCISVQRIFVHDSLYEEFKSRFTAKVKTLVLGNPQDEATFLGPLIDEAAAARLEKWIKSAVSKGATVLSGGTRRGAMVDATLLSGVARDEPLRCEEAFGPVAVLERFTTFEEAIAQVNDSDYGLQAGVFTGNLSNAMKAWDELEVGGVVIGDVPSFRVDNMPYGGIKGSGVGREGVRYAMEDMSEIRLLVLRSS